MTCACGHHHPQSIHDCDAVGVPVPLEHPLIGVTGHLICADMNDLMLAMSLLPAHVELSRAEPGCLRFDIWLTDDPMIWELSELFVNEAAFVAHQTRTQASEWGQQSAHLKRKFEKREVTPIIRVQKPKDADGILRLSGDELSNLDGNGVLSNAMVAEAASVLIGYAGLQNGKIIGPFLSDKLTVPEIADALRQEVNCNVGTN